VRKAGRSSSAPSLWPRTPWRSPRPTGTAIPSWSPAAHAGSPPSSRRGVEVPAPGTDERLGGARLFGPVRARACSSVVEHRTFNPRVEGSIPSGPTGQTHIVYTGKGFGV